VSEGAEQNGQLSADVGRVIAATKAARVTAAVMNRKLRIISPREWQGETFGTP
jgi:hypothetical protein